MTLLATVSILLAATPAPAAAPIPGDVLSVGATQPFGSIQDAVTAADPGDVIVVDSGLYFEDVAVRETIAIVAGNGSVVIAGHLEVTGLAGGRRTAGLQRDGAPHELCSDRRWMRGHAGRHNSQLPRGRPIPGGWNRRRRWERGLRDDRGAGRHRARHRAGPST